MARPEELDATTVRDPLIGTRLGDYAVVGPLGEGGMAMVYEGLHTVIKKRVAIKVIKAEFAGDQVLVRRVIAEAHAVNAVNHRGIVDVHAHGVTPDGRPYLAMELLQGEALSDLLAREQRVPLAHALKLLLEATGPLAAAHRAGIVHRDLKPSNLFVCRDDDGEEFLTLLDFGLAKRSAPGINSSTMTSASLIVGTPDYMSPEQARGQPTDARTDLYALGVMAFELISGRRPYVGDNPMEVVMKHLGAPVPNLLEVDPTLPPALAALVLQLMAKEPSQRPQSLEPVRAALKQLMGQPLRSSPTGVPTWPSPGRATPAVPLDATVVRPAPPGEGSTHTELHSMAQGDRTHLAPVLRPKETADTDPELPREASKPRRGVPTEVPLQARQTRLARSATGERAQAPQAAPSPTSDDAQRRLPMSARQTLPSRAGSGDGEAEAAEVAAAPLFGEAPARSSRGAMSLAAGLVAIILCATGYVVSGRSAETLVIVPETHPADSAPRPVEVPPVVVPATEVTPQPAAVDAGAGAVPKPPPAVKPQGKKRQ